jgi:hypothetical protein
LAWIGFQAWRAITGICDFLPGYSRVGCIANDPFHGHPGPTVEEYGDWATMTLLPPIIAALLVIGLRWIARGFSN